MSKMELEWNFVNIGRNFWSRGIELYLANKTPQSIAVLTDLIVTEYPNEDGASILAPSSIKLGAETAQRLMDALWNTGLRPSGELDSIGQLDALKEHLKDMRQLTFKTLNVEKP